MEQIRLLVESAYAYPNLTVLENLQVYFKLRQLTESALVMDIIEQLRLRDLRILKLNSYRWAINNAWAWQKP